MRREIKKKNKMTKEKASKIIELAFLNTDGHLQANEPYSFEEVCEALKLAVNALSEKETTVKWHDTSIEPIKELPLLVITDNNKLMTFKDSIGFYNGDKTNLFSDWNNMVHKYHIKGWVYQNQLL